MATNSNNNQKKFNQFSDEIISPMFGYDYKNRVIAKNETNSNIEKSREINYLEKQIEEELEIQAKIAKTKEYQETLKTDTDVLKQYHKQKENQELKDALPSNYLNFRDSLEKNYDETIISDFDFDEDELELTTSISSNVNTNKTANTISEIIEDIFNK